MPSAKSYNEMPKGPRKGMPWHECTHQQYTAGPVHMGDESRGAHERVINSTGNPAQHFIEILTTLKPEL